ncbi:MAG: sodium:proton antiporter [bacterium]|nr:sodium:proton antiporter [bacterium]
MRLFFFFLVCVGGTFSPDISWASAEGAKLPGEQLGLVWAFPFVGILGSLALFPIFAPKLWHEHFGKISFAWSLAALVPMAGGFGTEITLHELSHVFFKEYVPFIMIAGALYTITGGIKVRLRSQGAPIANTLLLTIATLIASWIGTTGAAMLFIRPIITMNSWRQRKTHVIIFFIFLVCNIGGSLTALGDPPLFLGFLLGIDFFWATFHLFQPFVVITIPLLLLFFVLDTWFYSREQKSDAPAYTKETARIAILGWGNFALLGGVIAAVLMSGSWKPGIEYTVLGTHLALQDILRDVLLFTFALASLKITDQTPREINLFSWEPLMEVVKLFAAIFVTVTPVIAILHAGTEGALGDLVQLVTTPEGQPINSLYFWVTGFLSAFLDNAPTYLVFFHMAGGDPETLMGPLSETLLAISAGAVFMGALTYIGNAPNFMVKAIAESRGVPMPSFFGYVAWSFCVLLPFFFLVSWLFL